MRNLQLSFVVSNYLSIERRLLEFMDSVPFIEQNHGVVSPRLVELIIDSCSLLESVFRYEIGVDRRLVFRDYACELEKALRLDGATVIVLVQPVSFLRPFHGWSDSAPEWWRAYNSVKHNRIENSGRATYHNVIMAMAALQLVLSRLSIFHNELLKAGWFNEDNGDGMAALISNPDAGAPPPDLPVETTLFVSCSSPIEFVEWSESGIVVENIEFSRRVRNYLWDDDGFGELFTLNRRY